MKRGNMIRVQCPHCAADQERHVNQIHAEKSLFVTLIGIALGVCVTILLWEYYGAISSISFLIPLIVYQQQSSRQASFNSYTVKP